MKIRVTLVMALLIGLLTVAMPAGASGDQNFSGTWNTTYYCKAGWCAGESFPSNGVVFVQAEGSSKVYNGTGGFVGNVSGRTLSFTGADGSYTFTEVLTLSADGNSYQGPDKDSNGTSGTVIGTRVAPPASMSITLTGVRSPSNSVTVTMTLNNTGTSDISGLSFTDPTGLENDGVALANGNIGPTQSGLTLTSGPTPALPTSLPANGPPVVIRYTYAATTSGDAVLVANATGTDPSGSPVTDKAAVTVDVTEAPATAADYRKLVTSVILDADSVTAQAQNAIANTEASGLATAIGLAGASPGQQAAAIQFGLPPQMGSLIGTVKSSDFSLWVGNYYTTLDADLSGGVTYLGKTGTALATQLLETATDPQARSALLGRLWDGLEALPAKTQAALASQAPNLGYFGQALAASLTPQGQDNWVNDGVANLKSLETNVGYAVDGFPAVVAADDAAYKKDPTAYLNANSKHYADATYGLVKAELATLLGAGIASGAGAAAKAGYGALAGGGEVVDATLAAAVESSAPVAADSTAALISKAEVATSQFQTLSEGTPLVVDDAAQMGGMLPGDQDGVQKALKYIYKKFGVQLELGVRTSEPLSTGIDGSPKLSFMKPKAVSAMDMLIGGPSEIAAYSAPGEAASGQVFQGGVTTVFKPVPIPDAELAAIAETNPAFASQYSLRLASQTKLWNEYQDANSTLRVLVQGSAENKGGVTAITSVGGYPVPPPPAGAQPLVYLEQLDQPAFVEQFGLTSDQAQALKTSLTKSPGAVQVNYIARTNPDGSISFFDGLQNNIPYVSDLDLQYIRPADGASWPAGQQSQIELEFRNQLEKNVSRLPNHGASGSATDLPAKDIQVADSFVMSTTNPDVAEAVANNLAQRYASQAAIFSSNAARLEALAAQVSDPAEAKALLAQAAVYRETAAKFAQVDAAYLLAKYPPGEKIIVIKLGDVRVGYGP